MRLIILENPEQVTTWAAKYLTKRINEFSPSEEKPFVLGLPTGNTPLLMYEKLVKSCQNGELSFKNIKTFNMDEYVGIPLDHPESYHTYMWDNLFSKVDVKPENVHILDGTASDLNRECQDYENSIQQAGGIEIFVGGIGSDGHVAFNEPGSSLKSVTRVKTLNKSTILDNSKNFGSVEATPKQALTVGVKTIMKAREVVILATGLNKALALHHALECGVNHMWTCSVFQFHPRAIFIVDRDAINKLEFSTIRYFEDLAVIHNSLIED